METNTYSLIKLQQNSGEINFNALLNSYCREFSNWSRYLGIPKYDQPLASYLKLTGHELHLRFDFSEFGIEVFAPLKHYAESGRHVFHFPIIERDLETDEIRSIDALRFMELIILFAKDEFPHINADLVKSRLLNSIDNLTKYQAYFNRTGKLVNQQRMSFIETEQSLALGHNSHPLTKGRLGFKNDEELFRYSPETAGEFQLSYFLIAPEHVIEQNAEGFDITDTFKAELLSAIPADHQISAFIESRASWKVLPMHPWEAQYLLTLPEVKEMISEGLLYSLGDWGAVYTPTSSVRTVYNRESDWMYKFSLHVKITNSERINLTPELHRGYDISRLLKTDLGKSLKKEFPEIEFITDPAFFAVNYKGKTIDGFNTSIRHNTFKGEAGDKNVTLLAALCQDSLLGEKPRIVHLIEQAAKYKNKSIQHTAVNWFKQYLHICAGPIVGFLNKYGMAFEFHQQNVLVELDSQNFPAKLYFRDNQGFFFLEGKCEDLLKHLPDLAAQSGAIAPSSFIIPKYTYYLLLNNILGVVNALGSNGLADERVLIDLIYLEFKQFEESDTTGFVDYIINSRSWEVKGNLLTNLYNIDEASATSENPAIFRAYPNPLNKYFFCEHLIQPQTKEVMYSRYFPEEDVTISLRPFDIDRDLEMVHDWFNQEHAKPIWKMDGPIRGLETFYRTLIPGDLSHSFIGEVNGEPNFTIEPYWPMRDVMGAYYDALATDYGSHLLIAPTDKDKKFSFPTGQTMLDFVFAQPVVGKCIGEAAVESRAMHMFGTRLGYRYQHVIKMPHKDATLTFCYREWYWEKFPASKEIALSGQMAGI
ncbi:siderophore synthetase component [Pedobacter cryoconitis]|uniref:GNAT family N-acetyltransferase n=1 Tax=Pedobacter cryoconitis TaxID=188932 RepID=UPI00161F5333|nr:GNAT family N-acetyltransferase [Pedobacter cryoconitis]MBB6270452.1 siderophore synthetase component [Pedobacter cryoconitis]